MTKHPSRKVMNFRHLLGCDTIDLGICVIRLSLWAAAIVPWEFYYVSERDVCLSEVFLCRPCFFLQKIELFDVSWVLMEEAR